MVTESENIFEKSGIVFFSGGSALNDTSKVLAQRTHTSHIITTFDSGGSTAALRMALGIPAVGDIRSRLLALADRSSPLVATLCQVLEYRFPSPLSFEAINAELKLFCSSSHPLLIKLGKKSQKSKDFIVKSINSFVEMAPKGFVYADASLGNLVLAVQYFSEENNLSRATQKLAKYLRCRGKVLPVTEDPAHLAVLLENGEIIKGQHRFTGKWSSEIKSPISDIWFIPSLNLNNLDALEYKSKYKLKASTGLSEVISSASTICYPIGSFFSSVMANLLVSGVPEAIAKAKCPKIFIPNPGKDPELCGLKLEDQILFILHTLKGKSGKSEENKFITHLLLDLERAYYTGGVPKKLLEKEAIELLDTRLIAGNTVEEQAKIEGELLAEALMQTADIPYS